MLWPEVSSFLRWDPWSEIRRSMLLGRAIPFAEDFPPLNIWSSENDILIMAEMPGIEADKLDIAVMNDSVTISGSRQEEQPGEGEAYHRQERSHGRFSRSLKLPFRVDSSKVDARYEKGILKISLPRHEQDKPKRIQIKAE
jgi:HSP20 family protein